ncbi:head-tail joining protein [Methylobacterium gossipiicola]|uniref:Uncharacterized protein n=1 Tax=Methylobacterium gossipiicola TaxID=582675 RepID=A0A1I2W003_9HYPH|nr:hypothetical protein [Methylobacterium gossipiicola]SFG92871.1 hypothetical protein SAMN05192565_11797 [Methylobacterium gossipiicola]
MNPFALAVDAMFDDPNMAEDAIWRAGGGAGGLPVRIRYRSPEAIVGLDGNRFDLAATLIEVRLSEVAEPAEGDQVDVLDDDGAVRETVEVTALSRIDARKLVRTCGVARLARNDDP